MKHSELIREAKKMLEMDDLNAHSFVCLVISDTCRKHGEIKKLVEIRNLIRERLGESYTVIDWLSKKMGVKFITESNKTIQDYRARWMDSLADEYESVGK
jgi:hypothetical protein